MFPAPRDRKAARARNTHPCPAEAGNLIVCIVNRYFLLDKVGRRGYDLKQINLEKDSRQAFKGGMARKGTPLTSILSPKGRGREPTDGNVMNGKAISWHCAKRRFTEAPLHRRNRTQGTITNHGRDARATVAHQTCHSTKRTHFIFAEFSLYRFCLQNLMSFAESFANGFVLEKRTHLGRVL